MAHQEGCDMYPLTDWLNAAHLRARHSPGPWGTCWDAIPTPLPISSLEPSGPGCLKYNLKHSLCVQVCKRTYTGERPPCGNLAPYTPDRTGNWFPISQSRGLAARTSTPQGKVAGSRSPPPALIWSNYSCSYSLKKVCYWH